MLDGTVQPVEAPELDLGDAHLTRALEELARLVDAPLVPVKLITGADEGETETLIPQPLPDPIPIEVPLPPTPVVVTPAVNATLDAPSENSLAGEQGLLAELASLSQGLPATEIHESQAAPLPSMSATHRPAFSPLLLSLVSTGLFVGGMLTERLFRIVEGFPRHEKTAVAPRAKDDAQSVLTGRITFKTKDGESQPDRGARILVFPQQRVGEVKLSVVGFRPGDLPADQLVANAALKAMGGAATTVDDDGAFKLPIEAGSYRVLVLSHFQPREEISVAPELDKLLSGYFQNPESVLGRVEYEFSPLRIKGAGDVWDHSF